MMKQIHVLTIAVVLSFPVFEMVEAKVALFRGVSPFGSSSRRDWVNGEPNIEVIEPGLVLLRGFVPDDECVRIAAIADRLGQEGESGFYTKEVSKSGGPAKLVLNTGESRGRIYDKASRFPPHLIARCHRALLAAQSQDPVMPEMTCTHLLLNMYTTSEGLRWHRDIYENDGKSDHPVVNMCIGASCVFAFKHKDSDKERSLILRNGDVLLFGGPCRFIKHTVKKILLHDRPEWMAENPRRYSFTFRDSPEVIGREEEFKYFKIKKDLFGQKEFDQKQVK